MAKLALTPILEDWKPGDISRLRSLLEMTQAQFGAQVFAHARTIKRWEAGDTAPTPIHIRQLEQIARERLSAGQLSDLRENHNPT